MPCYNAEKYIEETLLSALDSEYLNFEIIIVDDGSTDNSFSIINQYAERYSNIRCFHTQNQGPAAARNYAIAESTGYYILPLDADDKIAKDYLTLAVAHFEKFPDTKLVYAEADFFGKVNGRWNLPDFNVHELAFNNLIYCSGFYKKADWVNLGGYDTNLKYGFEDWEFWIRLLKNGSAVYKIPKTCFFYRISDVSRSVSIDSGINQQETYLYIFKKHADFVIENLDRKSVV